MKLMLKTQNIGTGNVLVPATETDAEIFEKFRGNTWYKSDCRKARNPLFHDKGMALVRLIYNNQERYRSFDDLLVELKLRAGWYTEHLRSVPTSGLLTSMRNWARTLPSPIATKLIRYLHALEAEAMVVYIPKSISFADMDDLEFENFYNAVIDIALQDFMLGEEALEFIGARKIESEVEA